MRVWIYLRPNSPTDTVLWVTAEASSLIAFRGPVNSRLKISRRFRPRLRLPLSTTVAGRRGSPAPATCAPTCWRHG